MIICGLTKQIINARKYVLDRFDIYYVIQKIYYLYKLCKDIKYKDY